MHATKKRTLGVDGALIGVEEDDDGRGDGEEEDDNGRGGRGDGKKEDEDGVDVRKRCQRSVAVMGVVVCHLR